MKSDKSEKMWSWITGGGTYQAGKFEEDADAILEHYRNEGYVMAKVGQPELRYVDDSTDRKTRYVEPPGPGHGKVSATASGTSPSTATPSSRAKACRASSG